MSVILEFPTGEDDRIAAINRAMAPAIRMRNIQSIEWWMIHYYLMGYRDFKPVSWDKGLLRVGYSDDQNRLDFRYEEGLRELQAEIGRMMKMDLNPFVTGDGLSLDAHRKAALSQAILNGKVSKMDLEAIKIKFLVPFIKYGTEAIGVWPWTRPDQTIEYEFECIPCWELLPLPGDPETEEARRAICRQRTVPWSWVKSRPEFENLKLDDPKLKPRIQSYGVQPVNRGPLLGISDVPQATDFNASYPATSPEFSKSNRKQPFYVDPTTEPVITLTEIFIEGPEGTCAEYICKLGDRLPPKAQRNYWQEGIRWMMPLNVARYTPTDTFYGRGLCTRTMGINLEIEKMYRTLFENVQAADDFGFLMIPNNLGINKRAFKITDKPRTVFYQADYSMPENRPFQLEPKTSGDTPGRVAAMAAQAQSKLSGQSEMLSGGVPGARVESAAALGFSYEVSSIPMIAPATEIKRAFSRSYMSLLQQCREGYLENPQSQTIHLTTVDDSLAGIVFDPSTMGIKLDISIVPDPWDVNISIRDAMPKPSEQQKQEAMLMLQNGLMSPMEFVVENYKRNWQIPMGNRQVWESYQKAVLQVLILFGDGKVPGRVFADTTADNVNVFDWVFRTFMAKVQFGLATPEVKNAFYQYTDLIQGIKGGNYPSQMPRPEDVGMMEKQMQMQQSEAGSPSMPMSM